MTTTGSIQIDQDLTIHYEECGQGQPIVFIHGVLGSLKFFQRQMAALGKHYRCIALDLRGHGRSTMTQSHMTVPVLARDVKTFLEKMNVSSPILVGWSMGAFIIWDLYKQFGKLDILGAVIVDQAPTDFRSDKFPDGLLSFEDLCNWHEQMLTDQRELVRSIVPMMFHTVPEKPHFDWMWQEMCSAPASIAANIIFDQSVRDYSDTVVGYPIPTLVCAGKHSPQPLSAAKMVAESAQDGELSVFQESGHCLFWEEADLFNEAVHEFAQKLLANPSV